MSYYYSHEALNYSPQTDGGPQAQISELDIFSRVGTQNEIESSHWEQIYSTEGSLDNTSNGVQFNIKPSIEWTSLADSTMVATLSLKKRDAAGKLSNPVESEKVFPCNSILYNLWRGN